MLIKRVIGLPGETIEIRGGVVAINGKALENDFGNAIIDGGIIGSTSLLVGEEEYFVLGDNRNDSKDSRSFGAVPVSDIKGVAFYRLFPFTKMGRIWRGANVPAQ